jgi:hypothetical protein
VPTLRPRDIVVMDSLRAHEVVGVREAIKAVGAELRTPAHSPLHQPNRDCDRFMPSAESMMIYVSCPTLDPRKLCGFTSAGVMVSSVRADRDGSKR